MATKKCGRPLKKDNPEENKEKIIKAAISLIEAHGADSLTVRRHKGLRRPVPEHSGRRHRYHRR